VYAIARPVVAAVSSVVLVADAQIPSTDYLLGKSPAAALGRFLQLNFPNTGRSHSPYACCEIRLQLLGRIECDGRRPITRQKSLPDFFQESRRVDNAIALTR
jgi:hypothetical protein